VNSTGMFVDDDDTAYVIYSSLDYDHKVSIEKLTPDYLNTTKENYGFFPDRYVEGPILFKRTFSTSVSNSINIHNSINNINNAVDTSSSSEVVSVSLYYASYGSCCCFCRGGSGAVFFIAEKLSGPWKRVGNDKNCLDNVAVCGMYGDRSCNQLIIPAQGIGLSILPSSGDNYYIWHGERWLSAPNNPPGCPDECRGDLGICEFQDTYIKGHGLAYWYPLEFDKNSGEVLQFSPFKYSFVLDLP